MLKKIRVSVFLALVLGVFSYFQYETLAQKIAPLFSSETVDNQQENYPKQSADNFEIIRNSPQTVVSYTGPAVVIPDNNTTGVTVTIPVSGVGTVSDLDFKFDTGGACDATVGNTNAAVDHTFVGDLIFKLTSPSGAVSTFMANRGGTRENICQTNINDEGGFPNVSTLTSVTGTPVSGDFSPETTGPLSVFDGTNANGNWTLNVVDNANLDTGNLRRFSLVLNEAGSSVLLINDVAVTEGNSGTTNATFTVTLVPAAAAPVTVNYATADLTATAGSDYTSTAGTLTFAVGETTKTINVPILGDTTFEPNETFAVNLTAPSGATISDAQGIGTINNDDSSSSPACVFSNGGLNPTSVSKSGVAAPAGSFFSELQNDFGNTAVSNTGAGSAVTQGTFRLADDFVVPTGGCTLSTVTFFAYLTGAAATPSPFTAYTLQIWNGRPGDVGSTIVFGDTTTNRLATSVDSGIFRLFNSSVPPPGTAPGTTRRIWKNTLTVNTTLPAGTYWLDWASTVSTAAAHFQPNLTIEGARGKAGSNSRQLTVSTNVWADVVDAGNPATPPSVNQEFPFYLNNVSSETPFDFNGDGKTDYSVWRPSNTDGVPDFHVLPNGSSAFSGVAWGLTTDKPAVADYDGDGKADFAVWREAPANQAAFYILQSSTNTIRTELFGQTGDKPNVVGDWDGDGKADVAVYRNAAIGNQSYFFYRGSFNNPSGNITFLPWGTNGDEGLRGDFDGDGRQDAAVYRPSNSTWYVLRSSNSTLQLANWGLTSDKRLEGDFDGDRKTDFAVFRPSDNTWYILRSSDGGTVFQPFGASGDQLVPGDYNGDGITDIAVFRAGLWIVLNSSGNYVTYQGFGQAGDVAIPSSFIP